MRAALSGGRFAPTNTILKLHIFAAQVLVSTPKRNYTASQLKDLMADMGDAQSAAF